MKNVTLEETQCLTNMEKAAHLWCSNVHMKSATVLHPKEGQNSSQTMSGDSWHGEKWDLLPACGSVSQRKHLGRKVENRPVKLNL